MDVRVVGVKVGDKEHAQEAWKALEARHEAGETDDVEVLGVWKNERGEVQTKFLDGLGDFVENEGAAVFALVLEGDAGALAAWSIETYPGAETEIVDPEAFNADLDALSAEVEPESEGAPA
jgi:hypothetical protein